MVVNRPVAAGVVAGTEVGARYIDPCINRRVRGDWRGLERRRDEADEQKHGGDDAPHRRAIYR
jgi:hypothetical protein